MFAKVVADRYARAVLQSCPDLATIDRVDFELTLLEETYVKSPETRAFFLNPKIPPKIKIRIVEASLGDKFTPIVLNLLKLLIEKHRQDIIPDISERYNQLTDSVRGVEKAEIIVASKLPQDLEVALRDRIETELEGKKRMPYLSTFEREAMKRGEEKGLEKGEKEGKKEGLQAGIRLGLKLRFGEAGLALLPDLAKIEDNDRLRRLLDALERVKGIEEFRALIAR